METRRKAGRLKMSKKKVTLLGLLFVERERGKKNVHQIRVWVSSQFLIYWLCKYGEMEQYGRTVWICLSLSPSVCCCRIVCKYSARWEVCFGCWMIKILVLRVLPAAVPLVCVIASAHDSLCFFSFFFSSFCVSLSFLTLFLWLLLFLFPLSLQHVPPFLFLCLYTPPPPLPFLPFPLGSGAKVGWRTKANTAQGRAEGDPKAGKLIMCMLVF